MMKFRTTGRLSVNFVLLTLAATGCAGSSPEPDETKESTYVESLYALMSHVYTNDDRTVFLKTFSSLDTDELTLKDAREFPGVANFDSVGGRLLVSSGDEPSITAYRIDDEQRWQELDTVSFAEYPLFDNANLFYQYLVDERHMYMPFETVKRIVWDPTKLEIKTTFEDSVMELRKGALSLEHAGNRSGTRYEDSDTLVPFFYHDDDWYDFGEVSFIAVYDRKTHKEKKVLEAPCPGLAITSRDESANTYFSTYDYGPIRPLAGIGPKPCVVRVTPELELDEAFTTDLTSLTDGRVVTNFRYIRDGWGLGNVFHAERSDVDFTREEVSAEAFDEAWVDKNWSVWFFDLDKGEARPFDEIEVPSFGWTTTTVDGRLFLNVPYDSSARTKFYELDERGGVREHLEVVGDAAFIKIR